MSHHFTSLTPLPAPLPAVDEMGANIGRVVGRYRITALVGESPLGAVYRAEQEGGAGVWLRLLPSTLTTRIAVGRFAGALQSLAATADPHFARFVEWGEVDGVYFIASESLAGCDLESALRQAGGIHRRKAFEIARQICLGLEVAHQAGILHGALHPRNVQLVPSTSELEVKLLEFGAHALGERHGSLVLLGDPAYLAPEQLTGVTEKSSDVYALALLVHELLTGRPVVDESSAAAATRAQLTGGHRPATVDATLSSLISRALSKTPSERPPSVLAFRRALEAWAQKNPHLLDEGLALAIITAAPRAESRAVAAQPATSTSGGNVSFGSPTMERPNGSNGKGKLDAAAPPAGQSGKPGGPPAPGNDSESVEASLEEFINQANASFPTSDGWDLHTGDVELIDAPSEVEDDDDELGDNDSTSVTAAADLKGKPAARASDDLDLDAPRRPSANEGKRTAQLGSNVTAAAKAAAAPAAEPQGAKKATAKAIPVAEPEAAPEPAPAPKKPTSKAMPVVAAPEPVEAAPEPAPAPRKPTAKAMPAVVAPVEEEPAPAPAPAPKRASKAQPVVAPVAEDEEEVAPAPRRRSNTDRTAVVAAPPQPMGGQQPQWTSNPLVLAGSMLMAFLIGAGALYFMTRNNQPQIVYTAPPPAPAAATAPTPSAPVVTPLPSTPAPAAEAKPVVTPLPKEEAQPEPEAPAADDKAAKIAALKAKLAAKAAAKAEAKAEAKPAPEKHSAPAAKAAAPKKEKAEKAEAAPKKEKPAKAEAAPAKEEKPAKKEGKPAKGGGDWVDPFAN